MSKSVKSFAIIAIIFLAPLAGCFGDSDTPTIDLKEILLIDYLAPGEVTIKTGQWHDILLDGDGYRLQAPRDVLLFVNGTIILDGMIEVVGDDVLKAKLLTTPYTTDANLTLIHPNGATSKVELVMEEAIPIVNGEDWFEKMDFITSVCSDPRNVEDTSTAGWALETLNLNVVQYISKVILKDLDMKLT